MDRKANDIISEHDEKFSKGKFVNVRRNSLFSEFRNRLDSIHSKTVEKSDLMAVYGEGGCGKSMFIADLYSECLKGNECHVARYDFERGCDSEIFMKSISEALKQDYPGSFIFPYFDRVCWQREKEEGKPIGRYSLHVPSLLDARPELWEAMTHFSAVIPQLSKASEVIKGMDQGLSALKTLWKIDRTEFRSVNNRIAGLSKEALEREIPRYFAEDLSRCIKANQKPLVILVDSFEQTAGKDISWLVSSIRGLICSIPGILWVIAGREKPVRGVFSYETVKDNFYEMGEFTDEEAKELLDSAGIKNGLQDSIIKTVGKTAFMMGFTTQIYLELMEQAEVFEKEDKPLKILGKKVRFFCQQEPGKDGVSRTKVERSSFKEIFSLYLSLFNREERRVFFALAYVGKWNVRIAKAVLDAVNPDNSEKDFAEPYQKAYKSVISRNYIHQIDYDDEPEDWKEKDVSFKCMMQFERSLAGYISSVTPDIEYKDIDRNFRHEIIRIAVKTAADICDDSPFMNQEQAREASELLVFYLMLNETDEMEFIKNLEYSEEKLERNAEFSLTYTDMDEIFRILYEFARNTYGERSPAAAVVALYMAASRMNILYSPSEEDEVEDGNFLTAAGLAKYAHEVLQEAGEQYRKELMLAKICRIYFREKLNLGDEELLEDVDLINGCVEKIMTSNISKADCFIESFKDYLLSCEDVAGCGYKRRGYELKSYIIKCRESRGVRAAVVEHLEQLYFALTALKASNGDELSDFYKDSVRIRDNVGKFLLETDPSNLSPHEYCVYIRLTSELEMLYDKTSEIGDPTYREIRAKINEDWIYFKDGVFSNEVRKWNSAYTQKERKDVISKIIDYCFDTSLRCRRAGDYAGNPEKYRNRTHEKLEQVDATLKVDTEW